MNCKSGSNRVSSFYFSLLTKFAPITFKTVQNGLTNLSSKNRIHQISRPNSYFKQISSTKWFYSWWFGCWWLSNRQNQQLQSSSSCKTTIYEIVTTKPIQMWQKVIFQRSSFIHFKHLEHLSVELAATTQIRLKKKQIFLKKREPKVENNLIWKWTKMKCCLREKETCFVKRKMQERAAIDVYDGNSTCRL